MHKTVLQQTERGYFVFDVHTSWSCSDDKTPLSIAYDGVTESCIYVFHFRDRTKDIVGQGFILNLK